MASRSAPKKLPVRGNAPGALDRHDDENWRRFERVAQALRSIGDSPMTRGQAEMTRGQAERLARRFGVHCSTIYRYRTRLDDIGTATAIAGHKRGGKSFASRLSVKQEEVVEQAIKLMRKKAGPLRVVELVEEVSALCRLQQIACPPAWLRRWLHPLAVACEKHRTWLEPVTARRLREIRSDVAGSPRSSPPDAAR